MPTTETSPPKPEKSDAEIAAHIRRIGEALVERAVALPNNYLDLGFENFQDELVVSGGWRGQEKLSHHSGSTESTTVPAEKRQGSDWTADGKRKIGTKYFYHDGKSHLHKSGKTGDTLIVKSQLGGSSTKVEGSYSPKPDTDPNERVSLTKHQNIHAAAGMLSKLRGQIAKRELEFKADQIEAQRRQRTKTNWKNERGNKVIDDLLKE